MIKGSRIDDKITSEKILDRVTEYDILRAFWPANVPFDLNTGICSPFHKDNRPSFIVGNKFGKISFKDFSDENRKGNVWEFVKQIENLRSYEDVLIAVNKRLGLGLNGEKDTSEKRIVTWDQPKKFETDYVFYQITTRKFTAEELAWWNQFHLDISDLKEENIFAPKLIRKNRKVEPLKRSDLTFCYWYPDIQRWKIYKPLADKLYKWRTNCPNDYVEHLSSIKNCKRGFLIKAKKDRMVVRKATGIDSIAVTQTEDASCVNGNTLTVFNENCEEKFVISDNDKKGKEFSWYMTKNHGYKHLNVPDYYREENGWTDFADLAKGKGLEAVADHFKTKGLI
jgi:hypothetical protein